MYTAESFTISEIQKATDIPLLEWKFQIENGNTGEMIVSDPLLETEALAQERAIAEFLKNSYELKEITFNTYLTDFEINDILNIKGLPYKVKNLSYKINAVSIITTIKVVRYE